MEQEEDSKKRGQENARECKHPVAVRSATPAWRHAYPMALGSAMCINGPYKNMASKRGCNVRVYQRAVTIKYNSIVVLKLLKHPRAVCLCPCFGRRRRRCRWRPWWLRVPHGVNQVRKHTTGASSDRGSRGGEGRYP